MNIEQQKSLQSLCTLATPALAQAYCAPVQIEELQQALDYARQHNWPLLILGGGSNLVLQADFPGLVLKPAFAGISLAETAPGQWQVSAGAGVDWQELVDFTLARGLWGLENLTRIPGTVGAAPIQNIGAYGVELESRFVRLQAWDIQQDCLVHFDHRACGFSYRDSYFKRQGRGRYIILQVTLALTRAARPVLNYQGLTDLDPAQLTGPAQVASRVAALRAAKLPDPLAIPNCGSFFHNPVVDRAVADALRVDYPDLVSYPQADGRIKLAAGWLIDRAGLKGSADNGVGLHDRQALVLVNPGRRSGAEVLSFARRVAETVRARFGVELTIEPQIYP